MILELKELSLLDISLGSVACITALSDAALIPIQTKLKRNKIKTVKQKLLKNICKNLYNIEIINSLITIFTSSFTVLPT